MVVMVMVDWDAAAKVGGGGEGFMKVDTVRVADDLTRKRLREKVYASILT